MDYREATLLRDCKATLIPAGDEVVLPSGTVLQISQTLGGSLTVRSKGGLFRIGKEDADALGAEIAESLEKESAVSIEDGGPFREEMVWGALRTCFDPEIPINIVDLGLVYDLRVNNLDEDRYKVEVKMTLTAQGCGMGPAIAADAKAKVEAIPGVDEAEVEIVWDPQWTPHMISEEGRKVLGLD